jgi:beta-lactamase class A
MELKNAIQKIISENKGNVGVAIKNIRTDEVVMFNEQLVFPAASTIKLVVMAEILRQAKGKEISLDETIQINKEIKTGGDGILKELSNGNKYTVSEILTLMIILSDNTAANILINMAGMENVNMMATYLGMNHTKLQRRMMDSSAARDGMENLTCAEDMFIFFELLYNKKILNEEYSNIMIDILKRQQVNGRIQLYLPEDTIIAHKTGDLDKLEHDGGIVYLSSSDYIICILTNETETNKDGREIIGKISKVVYDTYCY